MKYRLIAVFIFVALGLNAQVKFQNIKWEEAVKKAKEENKSIFVDVFRSKPADKTRKKVYDKIFTDKEVEKIMNDNFVCIGMDMSTDEGTAFAPKLYSLMYPCMVFYSSNEDQMEVTNAYSLVKDKNILIEAAKKSIEKAKVKSKNSRKILFSHTKFEDALVEAKKSGKMVFIDAYTPWCRPCAEMVMNVFNLNSVADFHNGNFINLKIDFYKERPDLSKKYEVGGFPAFLYIDGNGKLVHKSGGYTEAEKFISYGKEALKKFQAIKFTHKWDDAIAKAKVEGKMIFVDCYTSWCGPCKMLAKDVFTQKAVGDLFNDKFINVKLDMEKEGKSLKKFLGIAAYPTLVFLDSDKNIIHKVVGGMKAEELIAEANLALSGKGIALYEKKFNEGDRDAKFLIEYLQMLEKAFNKELIVKVSNSYFEGISKKELLSEANWKMIKKYTKDYNSREFKYLVSKRRKFVESFDAKEIDAKIYSIWLMGANSFITKDGVNSKLDKKGYDKYLKMLSKKKVNKYSEIKAYSSINVALELKNWKEYILLINDGVKNKVIEAGDMSVYNWALRVNQGCKDKELRKKAAKWCTDSAKTSQWFKDPFLKLAEELNK